MRDILVFLFCLLAFLSCDTEKGLDPEPRTYTERMTLVPTDTLTFLMGYRSNVYSRYIKKCEINGSSYLGVVNQNTNEIEFYSFTKREDDFKIHFQEEGPNGVGSIRAFEFISDSTMLIGSSYRIRLYVNDLKGNLLKTLNTHHVERAGFPAIQLYYTQQPLMVDKIKGDFYIFVRGKSDYSAPGKWSGTMFLKISDMDEESAMHMFELPDHLFKYIHGAYFSHSSHLMKDNRYIVFGIPFYNNLLIYDLETGEMVEKAAGSKYFGDALPWDNPQMDGHEEFYVTSNSYRELAYDEENKLLYRLAYRKLDYTAPGGKNRTWDNKPPSIIIINSDFEKIGEVDFPVNTVYTRMYFTHNGKLYLSLNHPDNNPSEDQMVFVGFKPENI